MFEFKINSTDCSSSEKGEHRGVRMDLGKAL